DLPVVRGSRRRRRRGVVIERKDDAGRIEEVGAAHPLEVVDRHRRRGVGSDDEIDGADGEVAGAHIAAGPRRQDPFGDRPARHSRSVRAIQAAPARLPKVLTAVRHMSSGRSIPATSAIPALARGPSPIAFSTISVVTSELPGTPAPANAATTDVTTIAAS